MRKRLTTEISRSSPPSPSPGDWLDLERLAQVEVSSEDDAHPIEAALLRPGDVGWRASTAGEQVIRIIFDRPQRIRHIRLVFEERDVEREQEFAVRWRPEAERTLRDVVRQQWNFSPAGSVREVEDYRVDLSDAVELELRIVPDRSRGPARASLSEWRMA